MTNARFTFAVHIVSFAGWREEQNLGPVTSEQLAESIGTSAVMVRRLLTDLAAAGIVTSKRGPGGGTVLARSATKIKLSEVYDAVRDPGGLLGGYPAGAGGCDRIGRHIAAVLDEVADEAETSLRRSLARVSVADVRDRVASLAGLRRSRRGAGRK